MDSIRRFLFILCIFLFNNRITAQVSDLNISASFKDLPLQHALSFLRQEYEIVFAYDHDLVDDIHINQSINNKPVNEALDMILKDTPLSYEIISPKRVLLLPNLGKDPPPQRVDKVHQLRNISGKIVDKETNNPLPYACIRVRGTTLGTVADKNGNFSISFHPEKAEGIDISYVGYESVALPLNELSHTSKYQINLIPTTVNLTEVLISDGNKETIKVSDGASNIRINPKKIYLLSGLGEPDITKAIQLLPGISIKESESGLFVRGGNPEENQMLLDGITFYGVDHFFGFFSAINSLAIKDVNVYRGGFNAKYGGFISSVIDITGKQGNRDSTRINVRANLLSTSASLESPLFDGKGSFFFAARGAITDILETSLYQKLLGNTIQASEERYLENDRYAEARQFNPRLRFYDVNFKVGIQPSLKDHISFSLLRTSDFLDYPVSDSGNLDLPIRITSEENINTQNTGLGVNWTHQWGSNLFSKTTLSSSEYQSDYEFYVFRDEDTASYEADRVWMHKIKDRSLRSDFEWSLDPDTKLGFGFETSTKTIERTFSQFDYPSDVNLSRGQYRSAYTSFTTEPLNNIQITSGLRYQYFSPTQSHFIEPRLNLTYQIAGPLKMKASWGIYHQAINKVNYTTFLGLGEDFWALSGTEGTSIPRSDQLVLGFALDLPMFLIDVEAYRKNLSGLNINEPNSSPYEIRPFAGEVNSNGIGTARGLDIILQKKVGWYTAWASYSLSEVLYEFEDLNEGNPFFASHDQRHQLKFANLFSLGQWDFSATWVFATGSPYSEALGPFKVFPDEGAPYYVLVPGEVNGQRLPNYHRLDLSTAYHVRFGKKGKGRIGLSVFNAYNRLNVKFKRSVLVQNTNNPENPDAAPEMREPSVFGLLLSPNVFFQLSF